MQSPGRSSQENEALYDPQRFNECATSRQAAEGTIDPALLSYQPSEAPTSTSSGGDSDTMFSPTLQIESHELWPFPCGLTLRALDHFIVVRAGNPCDKVLVTSSQEGLLPPRIEAVGVGDAENRWTPHPVEPPDDREQVPHCCFSMKRNKTPWSPVILHFGWSGLPKEEQRRVLVCMVDNKRDLDQRTGELFYAAVIETIGQLLGSPIRLVAEEQQGPAAAPYQVVGQSLRTPSTTAATSYLLPPPALASTVTVSTFSASTEEQEEEEEEEEEAYYGYRRLLEQGRPGGQEVLTQPPTWPMPPSASERAAATEESDAELVWRLLVSEELALLLERGLYKERKKKKVPKKPKKKKHRAEPDPLLEIWRSLFRDQREHLRLRVAEKPFTKEHFIHNWCLLWDMHMLQRAALLPLKRNTKLFLFMTEEEGRIFLRDNSSVKRLLLPAPEKKRRDGLRSILLLKQDGGKATFHYHKDKKKYLTAGGEKLNSVLEELQANEEGEVEPLQQGFSSSSSVSSLLASITTAEDPQQQG